MSSTRVQHVKNGFTPAGRWLIDYGRIVIVNGHIMDGVYCQQESNKIQDVKGHR